MAFLTTLIGLHKCNQGVFPFMPLIVMPKNQVKGFTLNAATIKDTVPFMNMLPYILCKSLANPFTILASLRPPPVFFIYTPGLCIPIGKAWSPGSPNVQIRNIKALNNYSKLSCLLGKGQIQILFPGQPMTILVP